MENKLVFVLVLYQEQIQSSPSYQLLKTFLSADQTNTLVIYDNSPKAQADELFNFDNVCYIHDRTNPGLAVAYNKGIEVLKEVKGTQLVLLDQDTTISEAYIAEIQTFDSSATIGAYVPIVYAGTRQISPLFADEYIGRHSKPALSGTYGKRIMGINSGTVIPAATLKLMGKFNEQFPLDFLDHWFFLFLFKQGLKIHVLNVEIQQELSVLDYKKMNIKRYESILNAETLFYKTCEPAKLGRHKKQLLLRTIKQFFMVKNRMIWKKTCREFWKLMRENK